MYSSSESMLCAGVLALVLVSGVVGKAASVMWPALVALLPSGSSAIRSSAFLFRVAGGVVRDGMKLCA